MNTGDCVLLWILSVLTVETAAALEACASAAKSQAAARRDPASNKDDSNVVL